MTNIMEVPSVSLIAEYDPLFHSWRLIAIFQMGASKLKAIHQINAEVLGKAYSIKPILFTALDDMTKHMVKIAPWISQDWLYMELGKQMQVLIENQPQTFGAPSSFEFDFKEMYDKYGKPIPAVEVKTAKDYEGTEPAGTKSLSQMADGLPGMAKYVEYPCDCKDVWVVKDEKKVRRKNSLKVLIMHINDEHAPESNGETWTSDQLCDWLDMLHDSGVVNLEVEIPDKEIENADSN